MRKLGRPCLKCGEQTIPVNVRLPESEFDALCAYARSLERATDRAVSLAAAIRSKIPPDVNESIYGPPDDRRPMDPRHLDALLDYLREQYVEVIQEQQEIIRDLRGILLLQFQQLEDLLADNFTR